jgi:hypothetical protein
MRVKQMRGRFEVDGRQHMQHQGQHQKQPLVPPPPPPQQQQQQQQHTPATRRAGSVIAALLPAHAALAARLAAAAARSARAAAVAGSTARHSPGWSANLQADVEAVCAECGLSPAAAASLVAAAVSRRLSCNPGVLLSQVSTCHVHVYMSMYMFISCICM